MDRNALAEKTFDLLATSLNIDKSSIRLDSKLSELSEDSIQLFEVVLAFERAFALTAKYEDLIEIIAVEDIIKYLEAQATEESQ